MEKAVAKAWEHIPTAYDLRLAEIVRLCEMSKEDICNALVTAYQYGFIKGTRARDKKRVPVL